MDGKTVYMILGLGDVVFALGIIYFAVHYSYWLLFLLLGIGCPESLEKMLLLEKD